LGALILGLALPARPVHAQPAVWVVVPTVSAETAGKSVETAVILERELRRLRGIRTMPLLIAKDRFEARASTEPAATDESDLDAVAREAQAALVHVATGRNNRARAAVRRVLARAEAALESLNRETTSARKVLDACLYLVRAMIDSGNTGAARARVLECRRLVPDIDPDPADHPPSVLDLLAQAEAELRAAASAELRVESTPQGCAFFLNGRHLGATPFEIGNLPPGEYRVQVECGASRGARVHRLVLGAEHTVLEVDARFDETVRSRDVVSLHYASRDDESVYRIPDAAEVARIVGAEVVVVASAVSPGVVRFDRFDLSDRTVVSSVTIPVTGRRRDDRRVVVRAARALRAGRSFDFTRDPVVEVSPLVPPPVPEPPELYVDEEIADPSVFDERLDEPAPAEASPGLQALPAGTSDGGGPPESPARIVGWVLLGLGIGGHVTSWGLYAELRQRENELSGLAPTQGGFLDAQERFDNPRIPTGTVGVVSGVITTSAMPLVLPDEDGAPIWSITLGVLGLAGVTTGAVLLAGQGGCVDTACTRRSPQPALGAIILGHALPFFSVPLVHWLRPRGDDSRTSGDASGTLPAPVSLGFAPAAGGGALTVRGRW